MIIERPQETIKVNESKKWVLVYGRRKTGKTFLIRNFVEHDEYFFIKRNRTIISDKENRPLSYDTFMEILKRELEDGRTVVVDEFHRLGEDFFDLLHYIKKTGRLILVSSTLFLSKKLLSGKSPLLGIFKEVPIGLISLGDCLRSLNKHELDNRQILELAIVMSEPLAVDYFDEKKNAKLILAEIAMGSIRTVPALLGEIFTEEDREISAVYEGVMRAVASGKVVSGEISSYLYSRKLIKKDDPSIVQQYLNNLMSFGILKRIEVLGRRKLVYKHVSPLTRLFYYADEKYNISERDVTEKEMLAIIDELMPRMVEDSVRAFLAGRYGLKESIIEAADYDIDACLLKFRRTEIALEIKWKKVGRSDVERAESTLSHIDARTKMLFVPDKKNIRSSLKIIDAGDLL